MPNIQILKTVVNSRVLEVIEYSNKLKAERSPIPSRECGSQLLNRI
jgi:hypothetical protein